VITDYYIILLLGNFPGSIDLHIRIHALPDNEQDVRVAPIISAVPAMPKKLSAVPDMPVMPHTPPPKPAMPHIPTPMLDMPDRQFDPSLFRNSIWKRFQVDSRGPKGF
jgi:hypothetical protein